MDILQFVFEGIFPVFLLIVLGVVLKRKQVVGEGFRQSASLICFKIGLPSLAFLKISVLDFTRVFNLREVALFLGITGAMMVITMLPGLRLKDPKQRGAFSQGCWRGNIAIVGLALILNLYGEEYAARGAMILAFILPFYNIAAVLVLTLPLHGLSIRGLKTSFRNIVTNPIVLAVIAGMFCSLLKLRLPGSIHSFLGYLADLTLPLALINIGASLSIGGIREKGLTALKAAGVKLVLLPAAAVFIFYTIGYRGADLGMIYIITGAPTAVSSHIMAQAMENDGELAALIVTVSTTLAALSTMIGISIITGVLS